jgi:hypothetical protein
MMKKRYFFLIVCFSLIGSANESLACGSCMYVYFDKILPPIWWWVLLSVSWYYSLSIYTSITETKIWGVFGPVGGLILILFLFVTSFMQFGPIFIPLLILPGIILSLKVFLLSKWLNFEGKRNLRVISAIGISCLTFLIVVSANIHRERTEAAFIIKYEDYGLSEMFCERLAHATPPRLKDLREIVLKVKNPKLTAIACEGIATYGDPVRDVPLLIDAYERIFGAVEDEKVESALSKLTGLNLPEGSSPVIWKEQLTADSKTTTKRY